MSDTQEMASTPTEAASPATPMPSAAVAEVLRLHPSKPPSPSSPLLRSALGFEASVADPDASDADLHSASCDEIADGCDATRPARGIVVGLALMLPFWGAVGLVLHSVLR